MKKVIHAVDYLHQKGFLIIVKKKLGIIHRDLKPDNIMCTSKNPSITPQDYKLIDFGLSTKYEGKKQDELVGTPLYMAPEILKCNICLIITKIGEEYD